MHGAADGVVRWILYSAAVLLTAAVAWAANGITDGRITSLISTASDPADSGIVRLGNAETLCWEASPTGTDRCLTAAAPYVVVAVIHAGGGL